MNIRLLIVIAFFILSFLFFLYLALHAERAVRFQARFHRSLTKNMPDRDIDFLPLLPTDKFLLGSLSQFVNRGPEHPEEFPRIVMVHRIFWGVLATGIGTILIWLCWAIITGKVIQSID